MECYQSCVDRGKRCVLHRDRISCYDCGKIKPYYNIPASDIFPCPPTEPCDCPQKEAEPRRPKEVCNCKQSCWNWILSFLGLGGELPECCKNVPLTPWESGGAAREALVSTVNDVVNRVSGRGTSPEVSHSSKVSVKHDPKEPEKKLIAPTLAAEKEPVPEEVSQPIPEQVSGKEQEATATTEKKNRSTKARSSSSQRGRSRHRKSGGLKSRSTSREKRTGKSSSKTRSVSTSSSGASQAENRRSRSRSRSRSSVKVFNPFKRRQSACTCPSSTSIRSLVCPALPSPVCPQSQTRSYLTRVNEDQVAQKSGLTTAPCSQMLSAAARPSGLRRSSSMSCRPMDTSFRSARREDCQSVQEPLCATAQMPVRSQSFHTTLLSCPSLRPVVLPCFNPLCRPCSASSCGANTFTCLCLLKSLTERRTPNISPQTCCGLCDKQMSPATSITRKLPSRSCSPVCMNPYCLCGPMKPNMNQYSPTATTQRQPKCMSSGSVQNQCLCSPSAPCTCTQRAAMTTPRPTCTPCGTDPLLRHACSTSSAMSYIKARQNDAICQQLLAKYGFSPPPRWLCPTPCYGGLSEGLCPSPSCLSSFPRCSGIGGCKACRPSAAEHYSSRTSGPSENYTNSRKPRSPDCQCRKQEQVIEFSPSPCDKKSLCEFQLPPHCIRETGPRSPVDEYLAILRLPKPARRQVQEEATQEKPVDSVAKSKEDKGDREKQPRKTAKKQWQKKSLKTSKKEDENASADNESNNADSKMQICVGDLEFLPADAVSTLSETLVVDCCPHVEEMCCNNNYGGQSYSFSPFSSAGPVLIDFGEVNAYYNRYSNSAGANSSSANNPACFSTATHRLSSSSFDVHVTPSFASQLSHNYSSNSRDLQEQLVYGSRRLTEGTVNNLNINAQKAVRVNHPLSYNNSLGLDMPETLNYKSKFHMKLEKEIENKIKELRDLGIVESPARRRYLDTLSGPPACTNRKLYAPLGSDPMDQAFIQESWNKLNQRAEMRRKEISYSEQLVRLPAALGAPVAPGRDSKQPEARPHPQTTARDKSSNKKEIMCDLHQHKQNVAGRTHDSSKHTEDLLAHNLGTCRRSEEQKQSESVKAVGSVKTAKEKSSPRRECVFHSLFEKLEETVQIFVRQKRCENEGSGDVDKAMDTGQQVKTDSRGNREMMANEETAPTHWIEENQSTKKLDKSAASVRTILTNKSSPPHKPVLTKSPNLHNSGISTDLHNSDISICTCSCRTNSRCTSSVSLEMTGSAKTSEHLSESGTGTETSPSYTKLSHPSKYIDSLGQDNPNMSVNRSPSLGTHPSQLMKSTEISEVTKGSHNPGCERLKVKDSGSNLNVTVLPSQPFSGWDSTGSSVDPSNISAGDGVGAGVQSVTTNVSSQKDLEDTSNIKTIFDPLRSNVASSTVIQQGSYCKQSSSEQESMSELMREFIRRNGTPV